MPTTTAKRGKEPKEKEESYPDEEQGPFHKDTKDEKRLHMKTGEDDEDIYDDEGRQALKDDDEIETWEEGFIAGASGAGQLGKDALTGKPLMGADEVIELELEGRVYRFVSEKNAEAFKKKYQQAKKKGGK